jgi:hypothetical protein
MNNFSEEKISTSQLESKLPISVENISADDLNIMTEGEEKLYDLLKEHFHNVRTMIIASAAIASANLLALQALQDIGISNWFLGSVVLLYLAAIVYVLYLTLSINVQTSVIVQKSDFVKNTSKMISDNLVKTSDIEKEFLSQADTYFKKITAKVGSMDKANKFLMTGNILFIIGLLIPIIGFAVLFIS